MYLLCRSSLQTIAEKTFADRHEKAKFAKVFSLESFPLYSIRCMIYPINVGRERAKGVEHDEMTTGECVNETTGVSLSENVHHTGLIEVNQFDQVFNLVILGWVGLKV